MLIIEYCMYELIIKMHHGKYILLFLITIGQDFSQEMWPLCFLSCVSIVLLLIYAADGPFILSRALFVRLLFTKYFPSKWVPGGKCFVSVSSVLFQTLSPFTSLRFVNAALLVLSKGLTCGCPRQEHIIELRPGFRHQNVQVCPDHFLSSFWAPRRPLIWL